MSNLYNFNKPLLIISIIALSLGIISIFCEILCPCNNWIVLIQWFRTICLAIFAAYIFFIFQVYIPETNKIKNLNKFIQTRLNNIKGISLSILRLPLIYVDVI